MLSTEVPKRCCTPPTVTYERGSHFRDKDEYHSFLNIATFQAFFFDRKPAFSPAQRHFTDQRIFKIEDWVRVPLTARCGFTRFDGEGQICYCACGQWGLTSEVWSASRPLILFVGAGDGSVFVYDLRESVSRWSAQFRFEERNSVIRISTNKANRGLIAIDYRGGQVQVVRLG